MNKKTIIPTRCFYDVSFPLACSRRAAGRINRSAFQGNRLQAGMRSAMPLRLRRNPACCVYVGWEQRLGEDVTLVIDEEDGKGAIR